MRLQCLVFSYLSLVFILLLSSIVNAQISPDIKINNIFANGTGCPSGSVQINISPDASAFSLLMDNYVVESSTNRILDRKNCDVRIDFDITPGWSYAIISADYRGFVNADTSSVTTHQAIYSFTQSRPINERPGYENSPGRYAFKATEFKGPISDNYFIRNEMPAHLAPWSPCSRNNSQSLYISTYLMSRTNQYATQSTGMITLDSIDGAVQSQKYEIIWKRCNHEIIRPEPRPSPRPEPRPNPPRPPRYRIR